MPSTKLPNALIARFFLPRASWQDLYTPDMPAVERVTAIADRMLIVLTEDHEWTDGRGVRKTTVVCAGRFDSTEASGPQIVWRTSRFPN